jgi:hypothetical protein
MYRRDRYTVHSVLKKIGGMFILPRPVLRARHYVKQGAMVCREERMVPVLNQAGFPASNASNAIATLNCGRGLNCQQVSHSGLKYAEVLLRTCQRTSQLRYAFVRLLQIQTATPPLRLLQNRNFLQPARFVQHESSLRI